MPDAPQRSPGPEREPGAEAPRRLFIGLFPDPGVQAAIAAHGDGWYWPQGSRRTRPSRLHVTLHFLGNVARQNEWVLRSALAEMAFQPFTLRLRTPQAWDNHIAVLLPEESAALRALQQRLSAWLPRAGLQASPRPWTPHVTLARDAPGAGPPEAPCDIAWQVRQVALVWSQDVPTVRYEVLARCPATEAAAR